MRLNLLCEMQLGYDQIDDKTDFTLVRPYGGEEGSGFGGGTGAVTGEKLTGTLRWVNHPHRRTDSVMLPDAHGMITTHDGAIVLFSLSGRTIITNGRGTQLLTMLFEAEDERYRWINNTYCVMEGIINVTKGVVESKVWQCINELADTVDI